MRGRVSLLERGSDMARVLFINVGSEGHINPTLGVVQELIRRGEEVIYFTGDYMRERVESTGARVITCDSEKLLQLFLDGGAEAAGLLRTADLVIPSLLDQTKGKHFDYIIHDSMFGCGRLIAQILDLPAINSCTSFAFQLRLRMWGNQKLAIYDGGSFSRMDQREIAVEWEFATSLGCATHAVPHGSIDTIRSPRPCGVLPTKSGARLR